MATEADLAALRAEFRPVSVPYVREHHPDAVRIAETYNRRRAAIDPDDPATIRTARRALARLMARVEANAADNHG